MLLAGHALRMRCGGSNEDAKRSRTVAAKHEGSGSGVVGLRVPVLRNYHGALRQRVGRSLRAGALRVPSFVRGSRGTCLESPGKKNIFLQQYVRPAALLATKMTS